MELTAVTVGDWKVNQDNPFLKFKLSYMFRNYLNIFKLRKTANDIIVLTYNLVNM